jgi:alanine racemase
MGRLGTRDPHEAARVVAAIGAAPGLELAGLMTHFATADERGDRFFEEQLERFCAWIEPLRAEHPTALVHAANSAATLRDAGSHFDMVRAGIAIYGMDPFGEDPSRHGLQPALELLSYVAEVKPIAAGESAGYGRRFVAREPTTIATVPIGYGDGWRRGLSGNGEALVGGHRAPLVGTVSMDNVTFDVGGLDVGVGDEVVLLGGRGGERVLAEDVARRLGTISYEVTCGLGTRVPREHVGGT